MNRALMIGACAATALFAAGCGSGGSGGTSSSGATLAMTIRWPARIAGPLPRNAQSLSVTLYRSGGGTEEPPVVIAGPKVVNRPTNPQPGPAQITFEGLTPGPVLAKVTAHGQRDAADTPCATGSGSGMVTLGQRNGIFIEMQSNAYRLEIQPPSITLATGARQTLTVKAYDFDNTPLLGLGFNWFSSNPGIAEVNPFTGEVKANSAGTTQIVVQEEFGVLNAAATVVVQ